MCHVRPNMHEIAFCIAEHILLCFVFHASLETIYSYDISSEVMVDLGDSPSPVKILTLPLNMTVKYHLNNLNQHLFENKIKFLKQYLFKNKGSNMTD